MITFKAIVIPNNRRKDGTYPVKIRVTFKGVSRRLPTTMVCRQSDLTRSLKIKSPDILSKSEDLISRMRGVASSISPFDLENHDVDWVVTKIKDTMKGEKFSLDYISWGMQVADTKTGTTRIGYLSALNAFKCFLGRSELDVNDITRIMIQEFIEYVDTHPKRHYNGRTGEYGISTKKEISKGASSRHVVRLSYIFEEAKKRYNDEDSGRIVIPRSPFSTLKLKFPPSQGQKNLGVEIMQKIISSKVEDPKQRVALDAFIVSFGLMGANMADMYFAENFTGEWIYNRQKTRGRRADSAEMRVVIPKELDPYIERLKSGKSRWWLPVLHEVSTGKDKCSTFVNRNLERWCESNGIERFTFYAGRHTWASLARKAGVEKATIDECLVHKGDFAITDIYAERSWDLMQSANRKVLDLFKW